MSRHTLKTPVRLTLAEHRQIHEEVAAFPWDKYPRPKTRGDCLPGGCNEERPCPWVSCKHHLYLDVNHAGNVQINFPDVEPADLAQSCSLDVAEAPSAAEKDGHTLLEVGAAINVTRERVRQLESKALKRLRAHTKASPLTEFLDNEAPRVPMTTETTEAAPAVCTECEGTGAFEVCEGDVIPCPKCSAPPPDRSKPLRGVWDPRGVDDPMYRVWRVDGCNEAHVPSLRLCARCDALRPLEPSPWSETAPHPPAPSVVLGSVATMLAASPPAAALPATCNGCKGELGEPAVKRQPDPRLVTFCVQCRNRIRSKSSAAKLHGFDWKTVAFPASYAKSSRTDRGVAPSKPEVDEVEREAGHPPAPAPGEVMGQLCAKLTASEKRVDELATRTEALGAEVSDIVARSRPVADPKRGPIVTELITIRTTPWAVRLLEKLAETGRYGDSLHDVAEELLRAKLREIEGAS